MPKIPEYYSQVPIETGRNQVPTLDASNVGAGTKMLGASMSAIGNVGVNIGVTLYRQEQAEREQAESLRIVNGAEIKLYDALEKKRADVRSGVLKADQFSTEYQKEADAIVKESMSLDTGGKPLTPRVAFHAETMLRQRISNLTPAVRFAQTEFEIADATDQRKVSSANFVRNYLKTADGLTPDESAREQLAQTHWAEAYMPQVRRGILSLNQASTEYVQTLVKSKVEAAIQSGTVPTAQDLDAQLDKTMSFVANTLPTGQGFLPPSLDPSQRAALQKQLLENAHIDDTVKMYGTAWTAMKESVVKDSTGAKIVASIEGSGLTDKGKVESLGLVLNFMHSQNQREHEALNYNVTQNKAKAEKGWSVVTTAIEEGIDLTATDMSFELRDSMSQIRQWGTSDQKTHLAQAIAKQKGGGVSVLGEKDKAVRDVILHPEQWNPVSIYARRGLSRPDAENVVKEWRVAFDDDKNKVFTERDKKNFTAISSLLPTNPNDKSDFFQEIKTAQGMAELDYYRAVTKAAKEGKPLTDDQADSLMRNIIEFRRNNLKLAVFSRMKVEGRDRSYEYSQFDMSDEGTSKLMKHLLQKYPNKPVDQYPEAAKAEIRFRQSAVANKLTVPTKQDAESLADKVKSHFGGGIKRGE